MGQLLPAKHRRNKVRNILIMAKYRKKPVVIEAVQFRGQFTKEIGDFLVGTTIKSGCCGQLDIKTLEGWHHVSIGDWIIRGVKGDHYPCKPDIFAATYEPV